MWWYFFPVGLIPNTFVFVLPVAWPSVSLHYVVDNRGVAWSSKTGCEKLPTKASHNLPPFPIIAVPSSVGRSGLEVIETQILWGPPTQLTSVLSVSMQSSNLTGPETHINGGETGFYGDWGVLSSERKEVQLEKNTQWSSWKELFWVFLLICCSR